MMNPMAIETERLTKRYGTQNVIEDLSLQIPAGAVVGCLGPNGAGKTTLMRMLAGHLHPTSGHVLTMGASPWRQTRLQMQKIAYLSQKMNLPGWMTAGQAIAMNQRLFPDWDHQVASQLLDDFALRGGGKFRTLSGGQQRKLMILLAMAQSSSLMLLDEPTVGLDMESRDLFQKQIVDLACDGQTTVFLSSHLLGDLERMVDRIVILCHGKLLLEGDLLDLKNQIRRVHLFEEVDPQQVRQHFDCISLQQPRLQETVATVRNFESGQADAMADCLEDGTMMKVESYNLEQLYLELVPTADAAAIPPVDKLASTESTTSTI